MSTPLRVLIVEDSQDDARLLLRALRSGSYDPLHERVDTAEEMQIALDRQEWDLVLSDFSMPTFNALQALHLLQENGLDLPFLIVSGSIGEDIAVAAMKAGAHDYIMKDNLTRLLPAVERELREAQGRRERKQLERQFQQAQKMESIGQLAGGIAHDFNNLLTAILGYAELAEERVPSDEITRGYLLNITNAAERAANLTRQLLAFARRQIIEPKVVDLNEMIPEIDKLLRRLIGEDIELVTLTTSPLGLVKVDPGQMEQVLINLAVNARDAMPEGGKLTIETQNVILDEEYARHHPEVTAGEHVMMAVTDTGTGMDACVLAHIFEPFFTTKEPGKGTGLGLATCHGIVKQNSGHIWVYSEPGHGTTFKVYLPRTTAEGEKWKAWTASEGMPRGTEVVLVVEDEGLVRTMAVEVLRAQGYTVLEAATVEEAMRQVQDYAGEISLLLTDMVMPQQSGKQLAEQVCGVRPHMRVLYMSGYTDNSIARQGFLTPGVAFLQKPFTPSALARKVREVIDAHPKDENLYVLTRFVDRPPHSPTEQDVAGV